MYLFHPVSQQNYKAVLIKIEFIRDWMIENSIIEQRNIKTQHKAKKCKNEHHKLPTALPDDEPRSQGVLMTQPPPMGLG
jgi:hypothetical protein